MPADQVKVLVVEDEPAQREMLVYNLEKEGYQVHVAGDGDEGVLIAKEQTPDAIILDWMLPSMSGIEACRQLKADGETAEIPIIMLTARGEEADRIRGLDTGADDYVVKPYSVTELMARIRARLRRSKPSAVGGLLEFEDVTLDGEQHRATRAGRPMKLGPTEFKLLAVFHRHDFAQTTQQSFQPTQLGHHSPCAGIGHHRLLHFSCHIGHNSHDLFCVR